MLNFFDVGFLSSPVDILIIALVFLAIIGLGITGGPFGYFVRGNVNAVLFYPALEYSMAQCVSQSERTGEDFRCNCR